MTAPVALSSQLLTEEFFSPALGRPWPYGVYLPPGYANSSSAYPTLYLLHGRGGDETSWAQGGELQALLDAEIAASRLPPLVAVMPAGGSGWYVDGREAFETALFADLLPHVAARYRTRERRDARILAGYSMGGFGALRSVLTRPELFGGAVLLSPALYDGLPPAGSSARAGMAFGDPFDPARWTALNYPAALEKLTAPFPSLFVAAGDADHAHADPGANVEVQSALLHARLRARGVTSHLRILPGGHDWSVWRPALLEGLRLMFEGAG